jgi:uncharacterized membrane protein YfcA
MGDFSLYLELGWQHITDLKGIDHILFVTALCLRYQLADWKKILILITAFTIGHSITLALSVFNIIRIDQSWIEFLIPITILITAFHNLATPKKSKHKNLPIQYYYALFFGFIHGMGFSNYLKSLLGKDESIVLQLLAFNIGLEIGQLLIVLAVIMVSFVSIKLIKINQREFLLFVTAVIITVATQMVIERNPFKRTKEIVAIVAPTLHQHTNQN